MFDFANISTSQDLFLRRRTDLCLIRLLDVHDVSDAMAEHDSEEDGPDSMPSLESSEGGEASGSSSSRSLSPELRDIARRYHNLARF